MSDHLLANAISMFSGDAYALLEDPEEIRRLTLSPTSVTDTSSVLLNHYTEGTPILDRERSIIAQNAGSTAASLVASAVAAGTLAPATTDELLSEFDKVRTTVFNGTLAFAGAESIVQSVEGSSTPPAQSSAPAPSGGSKPNADVEIRVGKYRGKTIGQVAEDDLDYLQWMGENINNDFLRDKVNEFLRAA